MILPKLISRLLAIAGVALPAVLLAAESSPAKDDYPLTTCVVSDEALGSMGDAERYVHREPGQPDRVVYFCCGGCADDFEKDPAKYLAKIDAAKREQGSEGPAGQQPKGQGEAKKSSRDR